VKRTILDVIKSSSRVVRKDLLNAVCDFEKPLTASVLLSFEKEIGFDVPAPLKHFYLKESNGAIPCTVEYEEGFPLANTFELLPIVINDECRILAAQGLVDFLASRTDPEIYCSFFEYRNLDEEPLTDEEKIFVKEMNKRYIVFAVDWEDYTQLTLFLFDKYSHIYMVQYDQDMDCYFFDDFLVKLVDLKTTTGLPAQILNTYLETYYIPLYISYGLQTALENPLEFNEFSNEVHSFLINDRKLWG